VPATVGSAVSVWKPTVNHESVESVRTLPTRSRTRPTWKRTNWPTHHGEAGANVPNRPETWNVPEGRPVTVEALKDSASIASSNSTVTAARAPISVALAAGSTETREGGFVSTAEPAAYDTTRVA